MAAGAGYGSPGGRWRAGEPMRRSGKAEGAVGVAAIEFVSMYARGRGRESGLEQPEEGRRRRRGRLPVGGGAVSAQNGRTCAIIPFSRPSGAATGPDTSALAVAGAGAVEGAATTSLLVAELGPSPVGFPFGSWWTCFGVCNSVLSWAGRAPFWPFVEGESTAVAESCLLAGR